MNKLVMAAVVLVAVPTLAFAPITAFAPTPAFAHAGGLDKNGCHQNKAKNVYECHQGPLKGQTFKNKAEAEAKLNAMGKSSAAQSSQQTAKVPNQGTKTPSQQPH